MVEVERREGGAEPGRAAIGWMWAIVGGAHCCLERQRREATEPNEKPCLVCCPASASRCSSSCGGNGQRLNYQSLKIKLLEL